MDAIRRFAGVEDTREKPKPKDGTARAQMARTDADILSELTYNILFLNDIVCSCFVDMRAELMNTGLYRFKVKQTLDRAEAARFEYEAMLHDIVKDKFEADFADMNQAYEDAMSTHIGRLLFSIKGALDKGNVRDSLVKAHVYRVKLLAQMALLIFDDRMLAAKELKTTPRWVSMDYLRLTNLYRLCDELARLMGYYKEERSEDVQKCIDILFDKFADGKIVYNALL